MQGQVPAGPALRKALCLVDGWRVCALLPHTAERDRDTRCFRAAASSEIGRHESSLPRTLIFPTFVQHFYLVMAGGLPPNNLFAISGCGILPCQLQFIFIYILLLFTSDRR